MIKPEKKRILFISHHFSPSNIIGAIRPSKLVKYLLRKNYIIDVFCGYPKFADKSNIIGVSSNIKIIYLGVDKSDKASTHSYDITEKDTHVIKYKGRSLIRKIIPYFIRKPLFYYKVLLHNQIFVNNFIKTINSPEYSSKDYDFIISSSGPISSFLSGIEAKKKFPNAHWINDFRDPVVSPFIPIILRGKYRRLQNKSLLLADTITAVSNGYKKTICKKKVFLEKCKVIYNGYDSEDLPPASDNLVSDKLIFTYLGALYGGKRKLGPLFKALKVLINSGDIDADKISLNYAGTEFSILEKEAEQFGCHSILKNLGKLNRMESLKAQRESHFLLLSTWNNKNYYGVVPGKFLEYMSQDRPIISIVTGNMANSEIKEMTKIGNLGCVYEEKNDMEDFINLKNYILKQYKSFIEHNMVDFSPNVDYVKSFEYKNITKQFEEIMESIWKKN